MTDIVRALLDSFFLTLVLFGCIFIVDVLLRKKIVRPISEFASLRSGHYSKPLESGEILYVQARHFSADGSFDGSVKSFIGHEEAGPARVLIDKDVLFASKGSRNFAAVYDSSNGPAVASTSFIVITVKSQYRDFVIPEYLAWFINHPQTQHRLRSVKGGTFIPSITMKGFSGFEIEIPDSETQKLILKIDQLRKKERRLQGDLDTAREKLLQIQLMSSIHK